MDTLWGGRVVATYEQLKSRLIELGCSTGTDEYGEYVNIVAGLVSSKTLLTGMFSANTRYRVYIKGINIGSAYPTRPNLVLRYSDSTSSYISATNLMNGTYNLSDASKQLTQLEGTNSYSTFKCYDFYIQEYYSE